MIALGKGRCGGFLAPCEPLRGVELVTRWWLPGVGNGSGAVLGWPNPVGLNCRRCLGIAGNILFLVVSSVQRPVVNQFACITLPVFVPRPTLARYLLILPINCLSS